MVSKVVRPVRSEPSLYQPGNFLVDDGKGRTASSSEIRIGIEASSSSKIAIKWYRHDALVNLMSLQLSQ